MAGSENRAIAMFSEMLSLQDAVNQRVNTNWKELAKAGKWDYALASVDELIELSNCIPVDGPPERVGYKWWSKTQPTPELALNIIIEYVDAFHFFMSFDLAHRGASNEDLATRYFLAFGEESEESLPLLRLKNIASRIMAENPVFLAAEFFELGAQLGIGLDTLYSVYIAKSTLNHFRQDNGYKTGTYIKNWSLDGGKKEDNAFLMEWAIEGGAKTKEEIEEFLKTTYATVKEGAKAV